MFEDIRKHSYHIFSHRNPYYAGKNHDFVGESIERTVLHFLETYNSYDKFHYLFAIHSVGWNTIESDGFSRVLLNSPVEAIFDRISD